MSARPDLLMKLAAVIFGVLALFNIAIGTYHTILFASQGSGGLGARRSGFWLNTVMLGIAQFAIEYALIVPGRLTRSQRVRQHRALPAGRPPRSPQLGPGAVGLRRRCEAEGRRSGS